MRPCSKTWSITVPACWEFPASAATCGVCMKPPRPTPMHDLPFEMFCYSVRKQVAAMIAALDGVDLIVFTGGIGENDGRSACGDLRRLVLDRRQPRRSAEPSWRTTPSTIPRRAAPVLVLASQEERADRPAHLGIVSQKSCTLATPATNIEAVSAESTPLLVQCRERHQNRKPVVAMCWALPGKGAIGAKRLLLVTGQIATEPNFASQRSLFEAQSRYGGLK